MTEEGCPDIPQERAALIAWRLAKGERLSTAQVARDCATSRQAAWHMLAHLSRILPIHVNESEEWQELVENSCGASNAV